MSELKAKFKLSHLLKACELPKSVYYYHCNKSDSHNKYDAIKRQITTIFHAHKGRYGYRRITSTLRSTGTLINHKTVQRLMLQLSLKSVVRPKRYKSYRGAAGKHIDNTLNRDFNAVKPNQKWVTDITEFKVANQRVYLSPIIDLFNQEVVSYEIGNSPRLNLVTDTLNKAINQLAWHERPLIHSDQGWQYQHQLTRKIIAENRLTQSMSRKGNCLDNAVAENFFGILKTEMYHGYEYKSATELVNAIKEYIEYYNHKRIKLKLKGLSPIAYRNQALVAA
ncbi:IS3 family transposase [Shewanella sp. Isolate13]|uniref:IS3 family transposase n=2 Tax=Shewanella sp. Isolate13 TaxID=2908531 RepID=UPI001EFC3A44|nr:IS3 family transposase [Shewanella sp. Isolate13]